MNNCFDVTVLNIAQFGQYSGQFLMTKGKIRVSGLLHSDLVNEKSVASGLRKGSGLLSGVLRLDSS